MNLTISRKHRLLWWRVPWSWTTWTFFSSQLLQWLLQQSSKCTTTLSWPLTLASLQLCCCWTSLLAFDCVDHSILLKVLQLQFGITASALQWISSFLALRSHSVKLSGSSSKIFSVLFGVSQDSILCPLHFILYTSNIVNIAYQHGLMVHLYADDTQLYIKLCCKKSRKH